MFFPAYFYLFYFSARTHTNKKRGGYDDKIRKLKTEKRCLGPPLFLGGSVLIFFKNRLQFSDAPLVFSLVFLLPLLLHGKKIDTLLTHARALKKSSTTIKTITNRSTTPSSRGPLPPKLPMTLPPPTTPTPTTPTTPTMPTTPPPPPPSAAGRSSAASPWSSPPSSPRAGGPSPAMSPPSRPPPGPCPPGPRPRRRASPLPRARSSRP